MDKNKILSDGLNKLRQLVKREQYKTLHVSKGDFIIRQHSEVNEVYWTEAAQFSVLHTAENGKTLSLGDYYLEDNFFGEMEFFSDKPSPFSVVATQDAQLTVIPKERFAEFLLEDAQVAFWMSHRMSNIYLNTMHIAMERSLYPLKFNIIKDMITRYTSGTHSRGHSYMYQEAQRFGCTERAYTRIVHELIKEGLVKKGVDSSEVVPVDIDKLNDYLEQYYQ
ncbi:Crp/Fnr family transcriptional regulator [Vibrio europaeus]|uniref:Crp/Fnr family transcriptional regulator n=1 Tax=Vibrio europaeus TaxID=300876 RepID=A0AAE7AYV3_9VIBR|nr:Crp/Fnr family transcriptional regulator [Vibrio europaeus]MDC5805719.1 Crp/Fnr family transcriptional regulator [Vibrio europaeus]MDC5812016.1 Crp/Fnr family transcriptional regulator [Vibrio europaeus]MDC5826207.1 Crp/Fnr family transcriptional regulator [Vibrio europaeus]MDC5831572.1 Crp/Fnr family transcriptional regulator [Vibrio europaeus]MDC5834527.1 Crp/Fnr family transcriptional regulator [Vibrio europaeus]